MDKKLFERLVEKQESSILGFKEVSYNFPLNKADEDAKFIKDLISFSNTVRRGRRILLRV